MRAMTSFLGKNKRANNKAPLVMEKNLWIINYMILMRQPLCCQYEVNGVRQRSVLRWLLLHRQGSLARGYQLLINGA